MARQKKLPLEGEPAHVRELDDAADGYCEQRDKRVAQSAKEVAAKEALIACMQKHKVNVYRTPDGKTVTLASKNNVKVTEVDESKAEDILDE